MIHPTTSDHIAARHMTAYGLEFAFHGKPAHAAFDPDQGINALDAVIQTFVTIGLLRQQLRNVPGICCVSRGTLLLWRRLAHDPS
jgi:metal-dependent amidase/aminoacylase/carboxypeptidase family protein